MAPNLNPDLDKLIGMLAEKHSLSKERKAFISLFAKSSRSQREEIILQLASLGYEVLMENMEK